MWSNLVLSIDIGTTSLKAALTSGNGDCAAFRRIALPDNSSRKLGNFWYSALKAALNEMKEYLSCISAVCISGNGPTIVSEDGTTLLWNEDAGVLEIPESARTSLFLPRILSFKKLFPETWRSSSRIFSGPEYLIYLLTGNAVTILPEKRFERAYWNDSVLSGLDIEKEKLPDFISTGSLSGTISKTASKETGLSECLPVFAGGPDFVAALVGTGTLIPGKICDRAGSSEGINLCTAEPLTGEKIRTLPSVIPGLWNASFLIPETGRRIAEAKEDFERKTLQKTTFSEFIETGLMGRNAHAEKILEEISAELSSGTKLLLEKARAALLQVKEPMLVTGGQAENDLWLQKKSNRLNISLGTMQMADAELIGDAILARTGLGEAESITQAAERIVKIRKVFKPESK